MEITIDRKIIDEVKRVLDNGLVPYLANNTVNFESVAFILQAIMTAVQEAEEQLDNN